MADSPDIKVPITVTADTAGAEDTEKSIMGVQDAAKKVSQQADVDLVKGRQAVEVQKQQAASLREIADGQQRIVAANLAVAVNKLAQEFRGYSAEADMAITATGNFLNVFATTGNPALAALALTATAVEGVVDAYRGAAALTKALAQQEKESMEWVAEGRRTYYAQLKSENIAATYQEELATLREQEAVLKRLIGLNRAKRDLARAQQEGASAAAIAGGTGTAAGEASKGLLADTSGKITGMVDGLAAANLALEKLQGEAMALKVAAEGMEDRSAEQKTALIQLAAKEAEVSSAQSAFADAQELAQVEMRTLIENGKTRGAEIARQGIDALEANSTDVVAAIQGAAQKSGQEQSVAVRTGLEMLQKIMADGIIKPEEMNQLQQAMAQVNASREAADSTVRAAMAKLTLGFETQVNLLAPINSKLDSILSYQSSQAGKFTSLGTR